MSEKYCIDHIAVVVERIEDSLDFWQNQLGLSLSHIETVSSMQVRIAFLPLGESKIELVQPLDDESGTAKFLQQRGPGMHHLCIKVDDLSGKLTQLKKQGVHLIDDKPVTLEDGRQLAFIHPRASGGVLVELYQVPAEID